MSQLYTNTTFDSPGEQTALGEALEEQKWNELRREVRACKITIGTEFDPNGVVRALVDILGVRTVTISPGCDGYDVIGSLSGFAAEMLDDIIDLAQDGKPLKAIQGYVDSLVWEATIQDEQDARSYN